MAQFGSGSRPRVDGIVSPILSQGQQTANGVIDTQAPKRRAARAAAGSKVLWPTRKGDNETEVVEVGYAVFTEEMVMGPGREYPGTYPACFNDLSNATEECRKAMRFVGFPYATTETGMGYKAERANAISTIAIQVGGLAPAWVNFQTLEAGTPVRYGDPHVMRKGDVVTEVYRAKGMTLENRVHATLRAATPPNFMRPAECGDRRLQADIEAVNDLYKVLYGSAGYLEIMDSRADDWGQHAGREPGPGCLPLVSEG